MGMWAGLQRMLAGLGHGAGTTTGIWKVHLQGSKGQGHMVLPKAGARQYKGSLGGCMCSREGFLDGVQGR